MKRKLLIVLIACTVGALAFFVFRDFLTKHLHEIWQRSVSWNINPLVFIALLFATIYPYYLGWFKIVAGVIKRDRQVFVGGLLINRLAWIVPYLYVLVFGENYPWWVPAGIVIWALFASIVFFMHIRNRSYMQRMAETKMGRYFTGSGENSSEV